MGVGSREYHILQNRVAVGRLFLGTIVDSREGLSRINSGEEIAIDEASIDHFHEQNVELSVGVALAGNAGVMARALGLEGVGGEVSLDGERSSNHKLVIPSVDTWQFEAEESDYLDSIKSQKVQQFLKKTDYDPVFMVTGIKFCAKATVDITRVRRVGARLELGVNVGTAVSVGPKAGLSQSATTSQKSEELTERILAIRLQKLTYKKKGFMGLRGERALVHQASNDGAELAGDRGQQSAPGLEFDVMEEDCTEEDMQGCKRISESETIWVVPESW